MKLDIRKIANGEYSWFLFAKGRQIARMPDGTAGPSKIKRTVAALASHAGKTSNIAKACYAALRDFEKIYPTHAKIAADDA